METLNLKRNPRDPLYFFDRVTHDSINNLIDQIRARTPEKGTLDVVFSSVGGLVSAATGFFSWMSRFERRNNLRVVAAGDVASAAVTVFLAFERRTADPTAVFRFHLQALEAVSNDPAVELFIRRSEEKFVTLVTKRTKFSEPVIRQYMEERFPMSGKLLFKMGICNEDP